MQSTVTGNVYEGKATESLALTIELLTICHELAGLSGFDELNVDEFRLILSSFHQWYKLTIRHHILKIES